MTQQFCEVEDVDPKIHEGWLEKHGFQPDAEGKFPVNSFEGKIPVEQDQLFENIRVNVSGGYYEPLYGAAYDERTFVMVCGGPSLEDHLEEIRAKSLQPDKYLVVCSNMTASYLLDNGIVPHVHFILDPQEKKRLDVAAGKTSYQTEYWINVACHPAVFEELKSQGIKPRAFLADFDSEGRAVKTVQECIPAGLAGMMSIQGGTMAGLRAFNLADAMGFRSMEYYGFDATVQVKDGKARPYAYEKKRGEAIIEIQCDRCAEKFDTTLIFQKQVNEFLAWRGNMPWVDVRIIGPGLIAHCEEHRKELAGKKHKSALRFTPEYAAMQKELHAKGGYGVSGKHFIPTIFHAVSQLAKRLGSVTVLDYGSSNGNTFKAVREHMWLPPVEDRCYDPFVEEFSADPEPADLVICTDVMEHVEPECTDAVLDHIASLTKRLVFFSIALTPANKTLSDGRNAHINMPGTEAWLRAIKCRFITSEAKVHGDVLLVVAQSIDDVRDFMRRADVVA